MKQEKKLLLFLLIVPTLAELISGSAPPSEYFHPVAFCMFVLLYGCGTLLIREAKVRWKLQYGVIFLAVAYGIIEEGILVKSYFNPNWGDLEKISGYGMYLGTQWPWTIMLTFFHGTVSTLIPITIAEYLWPDLSKTPVLAKRGYLWVIWGFSFVTIFGMLTFGPGVGGKDTPFYPNLLLLIFSFIIVILLVRLANQSGGKKIISNNKILSPLNFGLAGFFVQMINLLLPNVCSGLKVPGILTIFVQLIFSFLILKFVFNQIYNKYITKYHIVSLVFGSVLFYALLGVLVEVLKGINGMMIVGIVTFLFMLFWHRKVLKS
ncbi:MAG: hypothetical protein KKD07_07460 [Candidatus Omnitrophica bacterium]|nr:hypothetical protein [Candidatus Omnitrophota bacterium]MBU1997825.1 hypothetical protein [Candidatus Omnitrophota bacterium]MBU4334259.1 hypothetical protein [Candidatus Omnitrophota bacterium]